MNAAPICEPRDGWQVIALCAAWCGVCRDWRTLFEQMAAAHPEWHFSWVDVEDEAEALGDLDIETFPTLLIAQGGEPRFYGPVQPSGAQLGLLLASLLDKPPWVIPVAAEAKTLLQRLESGAPGKK